MIKSVHELSQILVATGILISNSQEKQILIVVEKLYASPYPHKVSFDYPCQTTQESEESCKTSDGEQQLDLEIEDFLT